MENLLVRIDEIKFEVNPFQFTGIWNHIATGKWEPETFSVFKNFIEETDVVIDIGSWAGPLTIYAAHLCKFVHSIDPDPVIFKQLLHNVNLNPKINSKVKCYNLTVWNTSITQTLYSRNVFGDSASSLIQRTRDGNEKTSVPATSIKDFLENEKIEKVDFVKMDIEGAEFFILPFIKDELIGLGFPTLLVSFHTEYLLEYFFQQRFKNKLLSKILFKICREFGVNLFSQKIARTISESVKQLIDYKFTYETNGVPIRQADLPNYIRRNRTTNIVFTNKNWRAN